MQPTATAAAQQAEHGAGTCSGRLAQVALRLTPLCRYAQLPADFNQVGPGGTTLRSLGATEGGHCHADAHTLPQDACKPHWHARRPLGLPGQRCWPSFLGRLAWASTAPACSTPSMRWPKTCWPGRCVDSSPRPGLGATGPPGPRPGGTVSSACSTLLDCRVPEASSVYINAPNLHFLPCSPPTSSFEHDIYVRRATYVKLLPGSAANAQTALPPLLRELTCNHEIW